ncbi:S41 family peptidase [Marinicella sp. W31]|uniref:S41 family peptidase n=1 Tax=Marinicella sp. W31 TaxID=3023713 RepID=UPI003757939B
MKSGILFILLILQFLTSDVNAQQRLTAEQVGADLELMWEALERVHPGYTRYRSTAEIVELKKRFFNQPQAQSRKVMFADVARFIAALGCEHSKAELPDALEKQRKTSGVFFPFKLQVIEGRWLVAATASDSTLKYGDEILAIDGRSISDISKSLAEYISIDGGDFSKRSRYIDSSSEILADVLNTYYGFEFPLSKKMTVRIQRNSQQSEHEMVLVDYQQWLSINYQAESQYLNFKDAVHWRMLDKSTAYLAVDTFVNYREPINPQEKFEPIFKALKDKKVETLILDVRNNGGGSEEPMAVLLSYLSSRTAALKRAPMLKTIDFSGLREHLKTWQPEYLNPQPEWVVKQPAGGYVLADVMLDKLHHKAKPAENRFTGRLLVLTSKNNSSGSSALLTYLQRETNATLIGELTGGNQAGGTAGIIAFLKLPNSGITVRVPLLRMRPNLDDVKDGVGVLPDVLLEPSVADFVSKRDAVFEKAVEIANSR